MTVGEAEVRRATRHQPALVLQADLGRDLHKTHACAWCSSEKEGRLPGRRELPSVLLQIISKPLQDDGFNLRQSCNFSCFAGHAGLQLRASPAQAVSAPVRRGGGGQWSLSSAPQERPTGATG